MLSASPIKLCAALFLCIGSLSLTAQQQGSASNPYILNSTSTTVAFGYYWSEAPPVLRIHSGDFVKVHTLITNTPERLEAAGVPSDQVEKELRDVQTVKDRGPGFHVLAGPIYIEEADSGDILEVHFKSIELAIPYGYNAIGQNGFLSDEIFVRKVRIIKLDKEKMIGYFAPGIEIPLHPFSGAPELLLPKQLAVGTALRPGYMQATLTIKSW